MKRTFAFLFLLLLPIELAAAVRGDKARYVGGTISSLPEATEGRLDTKNEEKLIFNSSQGSFEVPYKNITSLEYGQKAGRRVGVANRLAQPFASRIDGQNLNLAKGCCKTPDFGKPASSRGGGGPLMGAVEMVYPFDRLRLHQLSTSPRPSSDSR